MVIGSTRAARKIRGYAFDGASVRTFYSRDNLWGGQVSVRGNHVTSCIRRSPNPSRRSASFARISRLGRPAFERCRASTWIMPPRRRSGKEVSEPACLTNRGSDSKLSLGQHIDAPYRQIARQCRLVRERVAELPQPATTAICAFAALRLMAEHASWPQEEQNTFVLAWGPVLQLILQALIAPSAQTRTRLPLQSTRWSPTAGITSSWLPRALFYWWTRLPLGPTAPWPI